MLNTHNQVPLIQKAYVLYKNIYQCVKIFPKADKYNLGSELKILNIQLLELFIEAESAKKDWKIPPLEKASIKLDVLKKLVSLAHDIEVMKQRKYIQVHEQLQEIGRMLGGWIKSLR